MKKSISNIAWGKNQDKQMYQYLSKIGFDGLEIAPTRIIEENPYDHIKEAKQFAKMLEETYHLKISSMQSIWYGKTQKIFENEYNAKELAEYTNKAIDFANAIGCGNLVFGCPKNRNMDNFEEDYPKAVNFFNTIGEYALNKNVVIAVEPNPVIYNTNFLNTTLQALDFIKTVNLNSVKLNYDLGTAIYNKEDLQILKNNIKYINHIHISEPNLVKIQKREMHKSIISIIHESNYSGYISIEMKNTGNLEDVKNIIDYINKLGEEK